MVSKKSMWSKISENCQRKDESKKQFKIQINLKFNNIKQNILSSIKIYISKMQNKHSDNQEQQQWIVVTKNKNKHKGNITNKQIHNKGNHSVFSLDYREQYIGKFVTSEQFEANRVMFGQCLDKVQADNSITQFHVECLGLGNFLSNKKAFIQLQFFEGIVLPEIKKVLLKKYDDKIVENSERNIITEEDLSINMFDPAFSEPQVKYIQSLNSKCQQSYHIQPNKINVFFMPHCQRILYESVYQEYQKVASKNIAPLVVIGNSIEQYKDRCSLIKQKTPGIFLRIQVSEQKVSDYQNALNDTFILI